jgi:hypothetical protein
MSANDDDLGGDDDQLKQLRSVWVSMRESDEDPPDRGLDALMAAARTKAADMTPAPSEGFWTKVLAVFRRPPVLALASITVLLGGALFIAGRRDNMQVEESVSDRQEQGAPAAGPVAPVTPDRAEPPPVAPSMGPAVALPPAEIAVSPPEVTRPPTTSRPRANKPSSPPAIEKPTETKLDAKKPMKPKGDEGGEDAPVADSVGGLKQTESESTTVAPGATRGPVVKTPAATPTDEAFGRTDATLAVDGAAPEGRWKDSQVTQLVKQCESAAARNDCPAVRVLAKKIKTADAAAYKQRVANNTAIARCLE